MTKTEIEQILSSLLPKEAEPFDMPEGNEWALLRSKFGTQFSDEFMMFMEIISKYAFPGEILNVASHGRNNGNDTIALTYDHESAHGAWNVDMIPFYAIGNGDYFCLSAKGGVMSPVYYVYHENGHCEQYAASFVNWLLGLERFLQG